MAGGDNGWAALARRGIVSTRGAQLPTMAARGAIGALPEESPSQARPAAAESAGGAVARVGAANHAEAAQVLSPDVVDASVAKADSVSRPDVDEDEGADLIPSSFRGNPMAALVRRQEMDPVSRSYQETSSSPYSALVKDAGRPVAAIRDVQAVKIVHQLVCGIALSPGSSAPKDVKAKVLRDQILQIHAAAVELAEAMGLDSSRNDWMVAQCAETLSAAVAHHQLGRPAATGAQVEAFINEARQLMAGAVSRRNEELADVVGALVHGRYRPVTSDDPAAADDRLRVSLAGAAGDLLDKVLSPSLMLDGRTFSYGLDPARVVEMLSAELVATATKAAIDLNSIDMQIAHLQGSLRRVAALIGHEYVHMTLGMLAWVKEVGAGERAAERTRQAQDWLTKTGVAEIVSRAKASFLTVERIAPALLEQAKADGALPPSARAERGG